MYVPMYELCYSLRPVRHIITQQHTSQDIRTSDGTRLQREIKIQPHSEINK